MRFPSRPVQIAPKLRDNSRNFQKCSHPNSLKWVHYPHVTELSKITYEVSEKQTYILCWDLALSFKFKGLWSSVRSLTWGKHVRLTRHKAAKGHGSLSHEVSPNRVMVPNEKSNQSYLRHVNGKSECFLPNRIKPCKTNRAEMRWNKAIASASLNFQDA